MTQFSTSQEAMQRGAASVDEATNQIQGHIQALRGEVETMRASWGGQASTAFMGVHEAFEQQANKINTALRNMHEALVATHRTYGSQETTETDTMSGLAGQINS